MYFTDDFKNNKLLVNDKPLIQKLAKVLSNCQISNYQETLNKHFEEFSYINGYEICGKDYLLQSILTKEKWDAVKFSHLTRWLKHVERKLPSGTFQVSNYSD